MNSKKNSTTTPECEERLLRPSALSTFLLLILVSGLTACSNSSQDKSQIYRILKNRQIVKSTFVQANKQAKVYNFSIVDGDNLVFSYNHIPDPNDGPSDNTNESIVFQINPNLKSFSYKNAELDSISAFYMQDGKDLMQYPIIKGDISGKQINNSAWDVHMLIHVDTPNGMISKKIDHTFKTEVIK